MFRRVGTCKAGIWGEKLGLGRESGQGQNRTADTRIFSSAVQYRGTGTTKQHHTLPVTTQALRPPPRAAVVLVVGAPVPWFGGQPGDIRAARPGLALIAAPFAYQ